MVYEEFDGKVVIVTGSSAGIGQVAAVEFAKAGAFVTIHGRSVAGLEKTEKLIEAAGVSGSRVLRVQGEIQEDTTLKALVDQTVAKFGRIDVLIANAGIGVYNKTDQQDPAAMEYLFQVNLFSAVKLLQLAAPHLEKTQGNCVYVSSIVAMTHSAAMPFYCMTKAALDSWIRNAALIYGPKGVRVNGINPGGVATDFMKRFGGGDAMADMVTKFMRSTNPLGRISESIEQVHALLFIASERGSYVNGSNFVIDGGQRLVGPKFEGF